MSQPANWGVPQAGPQTPNTMASRMQGSLDALLSDHSGAAAPAYKVAGTRWADTSVAGTITVKQWDGSAWRALYSIDIATGIVTHLGDAYSASQIDALMSIGWSFMPIGLWLPLADHLTGVVAPPTDKPYRFIKLTAGLTGTGAYNNGCLSSESVSGSAPQVSATAVVSLSGSPLNGQTVRLINTERRFVRGYDTSGQIMDDAFQGHTVKWGSGGSGDGASLPTNSGGSSYALPWYSAGGVGQNPAYWALIADATNGTPRTANETRGKFIGATYYMRIK
jgi:hypothetical protein